MFKKVLFPLLALIASAQAFAPVSQSGTLSLDINIEMELLT